MSSLVRNPEGKRQLHKWRRHSLTARFWSWTGVMDNWFIPLVTKPASLKPVYFSRMIHQRFPSCIRDGQFERKISAFYDKCVSVLTRAQNSLLWSLTIVSVFGYYDHQGLNLPFLSFGYKNPPGGGHRRNVITESVVWCVEAFVVILITSNPFCSWTRCPRLGCVARVVTQDGVLEEPRACFSALLLPSWSSSWFLSKEYFMFILLHAPQII